MEKAVSISGLMMNQVSSRNTTMSSGFYSLIRAIRRANSRAEEDRIVEKELELIRQNLAQPDISQKKVKEFLLRLVYCEMLGQSASFAYIHALKMAQQGSLLNKRVGYLSACLFLQPQHELVLLLINTIQRDLRSTNILEVCGGLMACRQLISPEMIPAILPLVEEQLQHPHETVRKKAVLALHSFLLKAPQLISQMAQQFQGALCDRDPGVMNAALHIFSTLIMESPTGHTSLVRPLTSILTQIVHRKLPAQFEFRSVPAPWMQIQILNMLARLGCNNSKLSELMYDSLEEVLDSSNTVALISCGVQYECIVTTARIYPKTALLKKAAGSLSKFLRASSNNLRYIGLKALGVMHKVHPECSAEHQMTVVECLEDDDAMIKKATLNLLYQMCNSDNIAVITDKLLDCIQSPSEDSVSRKDISHMIVQLAEQFQPNLGWYVETVINILSIVGDQGLPAGSINKLIMAIQQETRVSSVELFLIEKALSLANQTDPSDHSQELIAWILGEYGCSEHSSIPASETLAVLCSLLFTNPSHHQGLSKNTSIVMSALTKAVGHSGLVTQEVTKAAAAMATCSVIEVRQKAYELQSLCSDIELLTALFCNQTCSHIAATQHDWTLSFLDEYVSDALDQGVAPYKPKHQRSAEKHNSPEVMRPFLTCLNFKPYTSPSVSQLTATGSSGSLLPGNKETATSSSPQASFSSGATGNSAEIEELFRSAGLKMEGVRKVWSQTGYTKQGGNETKSSTKSERQSSDQEERKSEQASIQPTFQMTSASVTMTTKLTPHPQESEAERRRQELAKALFGNMTNITADGQESVRPCPNRQAHLDQKLQGLVILDNRPFVDNRMKYEPMVIENTRTFPHLPNSHALNHEMLLDIRPESQMGNCINETPQSLGSNVSSTDMEHKNQHPPVEDTQDDEKIFSCITKPKNMPSLLDIDDAGQAKMMPSNALGEVPSLPHGLREAPCSEMLEELVFDANLRLMMRRVWQADALVLAFYLSSQRPVEDVKIILDISSNMKCYVGESEALIIDVGSLTEVPSVVVKTARLTSQVPAARMSVGGELSYKDCVKTHKRLFFQAPILIKDLIRPNEISTEEFGKLWAELSLDQRLVLEVKGQSIRCIMSVLKGIHLFPVEIIGNEGILAGSLLSVSSPCLIHVKLEGKKLDLWVRSKSRLLSQVLINNCSNLLMVDEGSKR